MKIKGLGVNTEVDREADDFYSTDPNALRIFIEQLKRDGIEINKKVWEPSCGQGHLSKVLAEHCNIVKSTYLIYRGFGSTTPVDFLESYSQWDGDILTNPPFKLAEDFVRKGMELLMEGNRLYLFLKIQFLEGKARHELFKQYPPKWVYVNSSRQSCYKDGDMSIKGNTTLCMCWFVFEKGWQGETILKWIR